MRRSRPLPTAMLGVPTCLAVAGLLASGCQQGEHARADGAHTVSVTLTDQGCRPSPAKIRAGATTFKVSNDSADKVTEAEVLRDGVIMGEKENLTPGLSGTFSLKLRAGKYQVLCPNAKTERWTLTVTGTADGPTQDPAVRKALDSATAGYHQYVVGEVNTLLPAAKAFTDAVTGRERRGGEETVRAGPLPLRGRSSRSRRASVTSTRPWTRAPTTSRIRRSGPASTASRRRSGRTTRPGA